MASKKCSKCGARNKVEVKKCSKCGVSFDVLAPSFVQGTAWSAADQYENPDDQKQKKVEVEGFWRTILITGIILTATVLLSGFGLPLLGFGLYGVMRKVTDSDKKVKIGIIAASVVLGILIFQFIIRPLFIR